MDQQQNHMVIGQNMYMAMEISMAMAISMEMDFITKCYNY